MTGILRFIAASALLVGATIFGMHSIKPAKVSLVSGPENTSPIPVAQSRPGVPGELEVRREIRDRVQKLMHQRQYAAIDAMARDFRLKKELTPAGFPKLYELHWTLQREFEGANPNTSCRMGGEMMLDEWERQYPSSPTVYIVKADVAMKRAWCWRGTDYASEVTEEGWRKFHANVAAAEALLVEHKNVVAQDPEFYFMLEKVYRAAQRDRRSFEALLTEAANAAPYYYPIYAGAFYYNMPQWNGDDEEIDAAARFAVNHTRSKDGLGAYARYYWAASQENCDCWKTAIDWPTMKQAMRDVAERYPEPWNLANFAKISCAMHDPKTARAYFTALGSLDGKEAWAGDEAAWRTCRNLSGIDA